ncbi:putative DNA modification/repair radical SAM protein [Pseudoroseomonas rhizosphaerae]|uniref:Putative DNA modification/repair radical SAM protein n=1 Tax=Teichococcus rhizosphaerae TaxID=1335062 RepID=A0A2C7AEB1_9PROT|nr:putative DNA modification/repair radical SAM protein [Pseudoroseomonas rhizosphaerae]PHK95775.1 putative DNA modification/repair radical SAM protein [Pseudoroseomonas rhizosphaerae]
MDLRAKLALLADAAKYDASCASSGTEKRDSRAGGLGSTEGMGICHAYAPDGRCISLLKVLLTNACVFDCAYCINRATSNVPRARFTVAELVKLTLAFYRRNYIEGLFLSSGIIRSPDYTIEQLIRVARTLREEHGFLGYIHLKTIPEAAPELLAEAGRWADRLSINVELPQVASLKRLAPEKDLPAIGGAMQQLSSRIAEAREAKRTARRAAPPRFAPAGQSTQMIVGADDSDDRSILGKGAELYEKYGLRRVYYSGYSPIPEASSLLPPAPPPLLREHRLYQADWLLRFYGFGTEEILSGGEGGMLDLEIDPKLAWALKHRAVFPVDINAAPRELLLRVPGLGARNVDRILAARQEGRVRLADLARLRVPLRKVAPFLLAPDHRAAPGLLDSPRLRAMLTAPAGLGAQARPRQLSLFP